MADFCKECSENHFGKDYGDMKGISTEEDTKKDLYASVICEGCGFIQVDHTGKCVGGEACIEKHIYNVPVKPGN